jgi:hypothetical protein
MQTTSILGRIILPPSVAYLTLSYFSTFHKGLHFRKKTLLNIKFVFSKRFFFLETLHIIRRIQWDRIIKSFSIDFKKILKYRISWKSVQSEPNCSVVMDRQATSTWRSQLSLFYSILGDSPASKFHIPTFRNILLVHTTYEVVTECSETSAHKIQTTRNHPQQRIQHSQRGEILNSRLILALQNFAKALKHKSKFPSLGVPYGLADVPL